MLYRIGVVAHTSRADEAKDLAAQVGADYISVDDGSLGCDDNHEAVQQHLAALPSTWTVVLEDDAIPLDDFNEQLDHALPMSPSPIVSLYLGKQRPPHWQKRIATALAHAVDEDAHWIISTHLLHAVGYAIRTDLMPSLLTHQSTLPVDQHITNWGKRFGHTTSYTVGSLVDHADWPTIVQHPDKQPRRPGRTAWDFGGNTYWTSRAVPLA
jgi:GR25 family glycosyltransferase involved in LPS biosynthesis